MADIPLSSAAQQRQLDKQLQDTIARAEKLVASLRASSVQQKQTVERAEAIEALTKKVQAAEVRVRNSPSDDNVVTFKRLQRELAALVPAKVETDETPDEEVKPVLFCPIDGVAFRDGACTVNRAHKTGYNPFAGMKASRQHLKDVGLLR
jgi:Mg-chelatase subunit ChlI